MCVKIPTFNNINAVKTLKKQNSLFLTHRENLVAHLHKGLALLRSF